MALNPFDLKGKTALVTGASSGLGREFSLRLAKQGANVVVAARRTDKLASLVAEIEEAAKTSPAGSVGSAKMVELDVSLKEADIQAAVAKAWESFDGIDILVNNAGVIEAFAATQTDVPEEEWVRVLNVNVLGSALVLKAVAQRMKAAKRKGSVIMLSSITGIERGVLPLAMYSASKAAIYQLTKAMAIDLGPFGIRINNLAPGVFPSEMAEPFLAAMEAAAPKIVPLGRPGVTDPDLTGPMLFLASDASAYVTGATIVVDGGHSLAITPLG